MYVGHLAIKWTIKCAITFRTLKENEPAYLADLPVRPKCSKYLRSTNSNRFVVLRIKTKTGSRAFSISGPALWNALPVPIRNAKTILTFWKLLKSHLFDLAFSTLVPQQLGSLLTNLLMPRLWDMTTLRMCAPLRSVCWGYRRYRCFHCGVYT